MTSCLIIIATNHDVTGAGHEVTDASFDVTLVMKLMDCYFEVTCHRIEVIVRD